MSASSETSRIPRSVVVIVALLLLAFAVWGVIAYQQNRAREEGLHFQPTAADRAPDRFLARFRPGAAAQMSSVNAANNVREMGSINRIRVKVLSVPKGKTPEQMVEIYSKNPNVEFAEVDSVIRKALTPNDPYYVNDATLMSSINAPSGWDITTGSSAVKIAILDTGIDATHPEFSGRIGSGYDFVNNDTDPTDDHGHGTLCAGVAAATGNNAKGVAGVDWKATIVPVKVLGSSGSGLTSNVAKGITWAADNGAQVLSLSLGGPATATLESAVAYAVGKNCAVVAAAGNDGIGYVSFPAAYDGVLAVGALQGDVIASFSNFGPQIDVCAPGSSVYTAAKGGGYLYFAGTSAATPFVAGLVALELAVNPSLGAFAASADVTSTATDLGAAGWDPYYGYGRINVSAALGAAKGSAPAPAPTPTPSPTPTVTPTPTPTPTPNPTPAADTVAPSVAITTPGSGATVSGVAALAVSATDNVGVARVEYLVDGIVVVTSGTSPFTGSWNTKNWATGAHTLTARATDAAGNSSVSAPVNVTVTRLVRKK